MRVAVFLLFISCKLFGQTNQPDPIFSVRQLQKDFSFMRKKMETKNPNLYLYNTKLVVDAKLDELYKGITKPMTATEFYKHITAIQPIIKDGHNYLLPGKEQQDHYSDNALYFPLNFVIYNKLKSYQIERDSIVTFLRTPNSDTSLQYKEKRKE